MYIRKFILPAALSVLIFTYACSAQMRQPAVSGKFYPDNKDELSAMINGFMDAVPEESVIKEDKNGAVIGIIVPHAGYVFSGKVAAHAFKSLKGKTFDIVVLIGQSHNFPLKKAILCGDEGFSTPLGNVLSEMDIINSLAADPEGLFEIDCRVHNPEHSLEVELPFLQTVLAGNFRIVPVLVGNFSIETCEKTAKIIAAVLKKKAAGKKVLFVISSDMSHYPEYSDAYKIDKKAVEALEKYDPALLKKTLNQLMSSGIPSLDCVFCGEEALLTGMYATKMSGADKVVTLKYANSGDVPGYGVKDRVVGYYAGAFVKKNSKSGIPMKNEFSVSEKNQKVLLELARNTISEYLKTQKIKPFKTEDPELLAPSAVFVTLTKRGQLRGCIGTVSPQAPLYESVQQMALSAAFNDYRFSPLATDELKDVKIEISVLSPLAKVKSADDVEEKVHGVTVKRAGRSGLFLPQVWEHFEKKEDFLNELCAQKAGLPANAWCDPTTELCVFTVFAFEEH